MSTTRSQSKRIATVALLTSLALIFSYIEAILPFSIGIPGVKLGLANIVVLIALYKCGWKEALGINLVRILIAGFLFSGVFGIIYSLAGGLLSFIVICLLKRANIFSIVGVSTAGAVCHNLGQILTASFIIENLRMFVYFPVLLFSGIATGVVVGIAAHLVISRLPFNLF